MNVTQMNVVSAPFQSSPVSLLDVRLQVAIETAADLPPFGDPDPSGMSSWLIRMLTDSSTQDSPIGSSSGSSRRQRAVLTVRPVLEGAPTLREVLGPGDTASTTVACQVITPSGELTWVHIPLEFSVTVIE